MGSSSQDPIPGLGPPPARLLSPQGAALPSTPARAPSCSGGSVPTAAGWSQRARAPAPRRAPAPATRLPDTSQMPSTWPPRVTAVIGLRSPLEATDGDSLGGGEGDGWHTSRTRQRFPPKTASQEGPRKEPHLLLPMRGWGGEGSLQGGALSPESGARVQVQPYVMYTYFPFLDIPHQENGKWGRTGHSSGKTGQP